VTRSKKLVSNLTLSRSYMYSTFKCYKSSLQFATFSWKYSTFYTCGTTMVFYWQQLILTFIARNLIDKLKFSTSTYAANTCAIHPQHISKVDVSLKYMTPIIMTFWFLEVHTYD